MAGLHYLQKGHCQQSYLTLMQKNQLVFVLCQIRNQIQKELCIFPFLFVVARYYINLL
jgi:hypothetical protein